MGQLDFAELEVGYRMGWLLLPSLDQLDLDLTFYFAFPEDERQSNLFVQPFYQKFSPFQLQTSL